MPQRDMIGLHMPALLAPSELHAGNAARAAGPLPEDVLAISVDVQAFGHPQLQYFVIFCRFVRLLNFNIAHVALGA